MSSPLLRRQIPSLNSQLKFSIEASSPSVYRRALGPSSLFPSKLTVGRRPHPFISLKNLPSNSESPSRVEIHPTDSSLALDSRFRQTPTFQTNRQSLWSSRTQYKSEGKIRCPAVDTFGKLLDGMISVLSSNSAKESSNRFTDYRKMPRTLNVNIAHFSPRRLRRKRSIHPNLIFQAIFDSLDEEKSGKVAALRLLGCLQNFGYDLDQNIFRVMLEVYIGCTLKDKMTTEQWLQLMAFPLLPDRNEKGVKSSQKKIKFRIQKHTNAAQTNLLRGIKLEVGKSNADFLTACVTWQRIRKNCFGEATCENVSKAIANSRNLCQTDVSQVLNHIYHGSKSITEEKFLAVLLPSILHETLCAIGGKMYEIWKVSASDSFSKYISEVNQLTVQMKKLEPIYC